MTIQDEDREAISSPYARRVGERLRSIRHQRRLSLQDVEAQSGQEFKASVLGAYERGERAISVPRLERLAAIYRVPVDQLLPRGPAPEAATPPGGGEEPAGPPPWDRAPDKITIDLTRCESLHDPDVTMLRRYLHRIEVRRQDFNGRVLTIRGDDIRAMAGLLGTEVDALVRRLDELRLRRQS